MADRKRKLDLENDDGPSKRSMVHGLDVDGNGINPYTGRQYSQRYYEILAKRKGKALC